MTRRDDLPRWVLPVFVVATLLALVLGGMTLWHALTFERYAEGPIEAWMTPGMIVHVYDISPENMSAVLGLPQGEGKGKPLAEIAKARGEPAADLVARVQAAVDAHRPTAPGAARSP
jgi:hypothetical protein